MQNPRVHNSTGRNSARTVRLYIYDAIQILLYIIIYIGTPKFIFINYTALNIRGNGRCWAYNDRVYNNNINRVCISFGSRQGIKNNSDPIKICPTISYIRGFMCYSL